MPAKRAKMSESDKPQEPEEAENTSLSATRSKRTRPSIKPEPAPPEPKQSPGSDRQTRHKPKIEEVQYYEDLFDIICSYQDESQRYLANIFYVLPSKHEYPEYYELIKKPIDLNIVAKNILANKYKSLRQLDSDMTLMFDNAKRFNDPKSMIFKDACKLRKLLKETVKELGELQLRHKLCESKKNRDKKIKLLQEISEMTGEELAETDKPSETLMHEGSESDESELDADDSELPAANQHSQQLISSMWSLFDYVKELKHQDAQMIEPFLQLPSRRLYPDYYDEIKRPVAMSTIKKKLNQRLYKSLRDLVDDFETMFKNAIAYNMQQSVIHQNAKRFLTALKSKVKEMEALKSDISEQKINLASPSTPTRPKKTKQDKAKLNDTKDKFTFLYNHINEFRLDDRELAPPFRHLPSKSEYPDYYNIIKKPIDMVKILAKISNQMYQTLEEMCADFCLMFENACVYNEPSSVLYKDALTLQRELFAKRDQLLSAHEHVSSRPHHQVNQLIRQLFDSVCNYRDQDNRLLTDSLLPLYKHALDSAQSIFTLKQLTDTIDTYTRMDLFQHHMLQLFDQPRLTMHPMSQTIADVAHLFKHFCRTRDDLCRNGEVLLTNALNVKQPSADSEFSERDALLVESEYRRLEADLESDQTECTKHVRIHTGAFYFIGEHLYCVLKKNKTGSKLLAQRYFTLNDSDYFKCVKVFENEVFKTDLYEIIDVACIERVRACYVTSVKDFAQYELEYCGVESEDAIEVDKQDVFVCESMYSTRDGFVRRLAFKKWCPLQFIGDNSSSDELKYNFVLKKRECLMKVERKWTHEAYVSHLMEQVESREVRKFADMPKETVQLDTLPSSATKLDEEAPETEQDSEMVKSAKYFEQIVHEDKLYKLGDYVYIKHRQLHANQLDGGKKALIFRIDHIWSTNVANFSFRGAVFLRATDVPHEPTRLFYRNEVFREISGHLTIGLDQVLDAPKCVVMSPKAYATSRLTHIDEEHIFVCESKYCLSNKTFRKLAKSLTKFELSVRCLEDEIFFMSQELVLRKHISPLLMNLVIDYEQNSTDYLRVFNLDEDEEWTEPAKDDENSSHSLGEQDAIKTDASAKKVRVKRLKKSGFQLFSREVRKAARDTQTSLSFTDMSKEVGSRWKALSDKERQPQVPQAQPVHVPVPVTMPQVTAIPMPPIVQTTQPTAQPAQVLVAEPVKAIDSQKQVMHRDAYLRYIANLRKNQQLNQTGAINNPMASISLVRTSDWYNGIEATGHRIKENRLQNLPTNWIDNAKSNDVLQNLLSLRYYLLQDAVTIDKELFDDEDEEMDITKQEQEEIMQTNDQNDQSTTLTSSSPMDKLK
ncbi:polybromo-1-like isoform X2 [Brachionus plicatilis]|uniref:Polybromo-1-like isoform X2 n=1 Tax=Brachionus plicatilis TaxID=10195 RepID=A0A3M7S0I2_BRAPC|nr:polybromo-1-like isoform X2 [Brachionus plicatilis]